MNIHGINSVGTLNQETGGYATLSGSFTGSFKGDGSQLTNLPQTNTGSLLTTASFNAYTQSNDQRVSSLETNSASVNISVSALNTFTASQSTASIVTSITNLNTFSASALVSITNINSTTASLNTSVSALNTFTASQSTASINTSITNLNTFSASALVSISNINSTTASLNTSVTQLNASSASQQVSIDNLNAATSSYITTAQTASMSVATASVALAVSTSISTQNLQHFVTFIDNSTGTQAIYVDGGIKYNPNQDLLLVSNISSSGYISGSSLNLTGTLTASLASGYVWVGNGSNVSSLVATSSFIDNQVTSASFNAYTSSTNIRLNNIETTTASLNTSVSNLNTFTASQSTASLVTSITNLNTFSASALVSISNLNTTTASLNTFTSSVVLLNANNRITGSQIMSGSLTITGSAFGNVVALSITSNTASMDLSLGNYFTLTLAGTATTHISASNVQPGTSATLVITTGTNSSASLAPTMLQPSGSAYSATAGSGKKDVLSIVSVSTGVPFVVSTLNMI